MAEKQAEAESNQEVYMVTFLGIHFHLFDPQLEEIDIRDIAKSLACIPRYNGHTLKPYFVGDHCVLMARLFLKQGNTELAKYALLHDSGETWYQDLIHPLKYMDELKKYRKLEKNGQRLVYKKFGLEEDEPAEVKQMDLLLTNNEKRDLCPNRKLDKHLEYYPNVTITPWGPEKTEREFLKMFNELFGAEFGDVTIP